MAKEGGGRERKRGEREEQGCRGIPWRNRYLGPFMPVENEDLDNLRICSSPPSPGHGQQLLRGAGQGKDKAGATSSPKSLEGDPASAQDMGQLHLSPPETSIMIAWWLLSSRDLESVWNPRTRPAGGGRTQGKSRHQACGVSQTE